MANSPEVTIREYLDKDGDGTDATRHHRLATRGREPIKAALFHAGVGIEPHRRALRWTRLWACTIFLVIAAWGVMASSAFASPLVPVGFQSYGWLSNQDLSDIASGWPTYDGHGLQSQREGLWWATIEPTAPTKACPRCAPTHQYQWDLYDERVAGYARSGIQWVPLLDGTPYWVSGRVHNGYNPPSTSSDRQAFQDFVSAAVRRYGPGGSFWAAHQDLPYRPVRSWEVWNEPNLDYFWGGRADPTTYAQVVRLAATALRNVDPSAEVILGGLARVETSSSGAIAYSTFLSGVFSAKPSLRSLVSSVAYHPYGSSPGDTIGAALSFRQWVNANVASGSQLGLWVNEFGWATQGPCAPICAGPSLNGWTDSATQASYERTQSDWLREAISGMMVRRDTLNLHGMMVWVLADQPTDANHKPVFFDSGIFNFAGLLSVPTPWTSGSWPSVRQLTPKPAWNEVRQLVASGTY